MYIYIYIYIYIVTLYAFIFVFKNVEKYISNDETLKNFVILRYIYCYIYIFVIFISKYNEILNISSFDIYIYMYIHIYIYIYITFSPVFRDARLYEIMRNLELITSLRSWLAGLS